MEQLTLNNTAYQLASDYKNDDNMRTALNKLTEDTFSFSFEQWYQDGFWSSRYIPYTLFNGKKAVSNVSISTIDFLVYGKKKTFVQIGTVMTDVNYRGNGLSRYLVEMVLSEWKSKSDMIYLYANDDVKDFYPKFGFVSVSEYQYTKEIDSPNTPSSAIKLDIAREEDKALLVKSLRNSKPISQISMVDGEFLVMFHAAFMRNSIYYIEESECVVFAEYAKGTLKIIDIFSPHEVNIDDIVFRIATKSVKKVKLGFTPNDNSSFDCNPLDIEDSTLFVLNANEEPFKKGRLMFPLLSHT